jgi:hypothetical protein
VAKTNQIFRGLSRDQRGRIATAVFRGEVLRDPEEARVAVRYARSLLVRRTGWRRVAHWLGVASALGFVTTELALYLHGNRGYTVPTFPVVVLSFYLLAHVYGLLGWGRRRERYARAERLNLQLAEAAGLTVDDEHGATRQVRGSDPWTSPSEPGPRV